MNYSLLIDPGVENQLQDLREFHESQIPGKGTDFLEVVWDCLEQIMIKPLQWQYLISKHEKVRRAITAHPQSIILYRVENGIIFITDIYDSRSDWLTP